jgi:signal transduction histidine kinase/ActR/RegA family two-component response regulator
MALLMTATLLFVNDRITREFQSETAQKLARADAVFKNADSSRAKSLLQNYRNAGNDPRFKAIVLKTGDRKTLRGMLSDLLSELGGELVLFTNEAGQRVAMSKRDPRLNSVEFESHGAISVKQALQGQLNVDTVLVGERLFDLVSIPVAVGDNVVGALSFWIEIGQPVVEEFKKVTHTEVILRAENRIAVSTLARLNLNEEIKQAFGEKPESRKNTVRPAGETAREVLIGNEHFLGLSGRFTSGSDDKAGEYLLLSSYEQPLSALHATQRMLTLASFFGILLSTIIVWALIRKVTQPLRELRDRAEAVGRGDFSQKVRVSSHDECGELALVFNEMTENLKNSHEQLEKTVETLKTTQAQLIQSEKLSAVGEFVAGVAHELNNPLTSVVGFAELMQQSEVSEQHRRFLDLIVSSAERCHKIVQGLLSFARQHKPERKPVRIRELIESTLTILQYQLRTSNIQVLTQFDANLPRVLGDPHQLQQVFLNIINNARQAIEAYKAQGTISILTETGEKGVRILFQDDGPGISAENLPRIFNPFFTTKEVGKGTGLGLSLSYGIIKEHGGSITAQSHDGRGASFIIELPAIVEASSTGTSFVPRSQTASLDCAGKRILVVDDEDLILELVREALRNNGCQLDMVSDGQSALQRLRQQDYDLTLCDWRMPGMNGQELYQQVRSENATAATRFVFMTGDVMNQKTQEFLKQTGNLCLAKPFSVDEFRAAIGEFLKAA